MKKIFLLSILSMSINAFCANVNSQMDVKVKTTAGCFIRGHNIHFNFSKNQASSPSSWHSSQLPVFNVTQFLDMDVQCSKGTKFYLSVDNSNYEEGAYVYSMKHNTIPNAPVLTYWLNNWKTTSSQDMSSDNILKNVTNLTRIHNKKLALYYTMLDEKPGWIKFAVEVDSQSIYNLIPGDYSDTLNIVLTY